MPEAPPTKPPASSSPTRILDEQTHSRVYEDSVRSHLFRGAEPAEQPRVVIVGGQPGAGKTNAILAAQLDFQAEGKGAAFINGDELRV